MVNKKVNKIKYVLTKKMEVDMGMGAPFDMDVSGHSVDLNEEEVQKLSKLSDTEIALKIGKVL